jgi:hypothetical protein
VGASSPYPDMIFDRKEESRTFCSISGIFDRSKEEKRHMGCEYLCLEKNRHGCHPLLVQILSFEKRREEPTQYSTV